MGRKLGYLPVTIGPDKVVVRTFKFLTWTELQKAMLCTNQLRLSRRDKEFPSLNKAPALRRVWFDQTMTWSSCLKIVV